VIDVVDADAGAELLAVGGVDDELPEVPLLEQPAAVSTARPPAMTTKRRIVNS
jgi:hypothetical protein